MFEIRLGPAGEVAMQGRPDASQREAALRFLEGVCEPRVIDLTGLECVASSGPRVFLMRQKRRRGLGARLRRVKRPQIHEIFRYAGFDRILDTTAAAP